MADSPAPPAHPSELLVDMQPPPPPHSPAGSNANMPFTPRSSTFPDDLSDDDQAFNPTPISSPGGPRYEDLPPSYDEAQQQALNDARAGRTPPSLLDLEVHRMVLTDGPVPPPPAHRPSLLDDPNAYEFEPENRSNARGLGTSVPVQQVGGIERIPVGIPDPTGPLLTRALEFTKHEPDSDARFASRLTRVVAIPQQGTPELALLDSRECGRRSRGRSRRERGRGRRGSRHMPGQWPDSSAENLPAFSEEPAQFIRAYAKALHSHSIRPAEFTEFLDGLNALCAAMGITATELNDSLDERASLVRNYIASTNESFFAPRGLKVSLKSLSSLVSTLQIPEDRGQRAGAIASALDEKSTNEQKAGALYPWVEKLETNVPASSSQMLVLREMSERLYLQTHPKPTPGVMRSNTAPVDSEKQPEAEDPDHSIPDEAPGPIPGAFPFGPGRGPFGAIGNGPFGKPGNGPFGAPGNTPFGAPGQGPHGPGRWGHWTHNQGRWGNWQQNQGNRGRWGSHGGCEGRGGRGRGWGERGCGSGPNAVTAPAFPRPGETNNWAAWGESIGKWGEEFGRHMAQWGEQFGKNAEEWGRDVGQSVSGNAGSSGQQSGVHRDAKSEEKERDSKIDHHQDDDDDDDTSSLSSSSSSGSSDSDSDDDPEPSFPDPHTIFLNRVREINLAAEASTAKGKKSPAVISQERSLAIEKAAADKTASELKIEQKREKWARKKSLRQQKREIKAEAKRLKKEMTELGVDRKEVKKEYRSLKWQKMKEHKEAKREARREWNAKRGERREEIRKLKRAKSDRKKGVLMEKEREERMTWVVIENLVV